MKLPFGGFQLVEKACDTAGFFLWDVFSRTCAGKNTVTRQIFAKIWRNRPAGRSQTVEKNPAKRFFDSLKAALWRLFILRNF